MRRFSESTRCRTVWASRLVPVLFGTAAPASRERSQISMERLTRPEGH